MLRGKTIREIGQRSHGSLICDIDLVRLRDDVIEEGLTDQAIGNQIFMAFALVLRYALHGLKVRGGFSGQLKVDLDRSQGCLELGKIRPLLCQAQL